MNTEVKLPLCDALTLRADGGEKPARIPKRAFQITSRMGVFTLSAGSGSVLGVSGRSVALQRRPFHNHRGVFVLLREAI